MKNFKRFISLTAAAAMSVSYITLPANAADTDAQAEIFRQMRCNNAKSNTATATGEAYYGSGYLINILDGSYMSTYNADPSAAAYGTRASAEIKTGAREYALMRVKLNSEATESVNIEFKLNAKNKSFSAYELYADETDWTSIPMTDYSHTPTSVLSVDTSYTVSTATGYDWSQKGFEFEEKTAIAQSVSQADNSISFDIPVNDVDNAAGYKDLLFMNTTSDTDATHIMVGIPTITTTLAAEPTAEPTATPTAEPTETPTAEPTATPTAEPTATPTAEPTATPTAEPTETPTAEPTETPTTEPTATPTAEPTATPTAEPTATPEPIYTKVKLTNKRAYRYDIANKNSDHAAVNGGELSLTNAQRSVLENPKLADGSTDSSYTSGQSSNFAVLIDLEKSLPIAKAVIYGVSSSAIIGLGTEADTQISENGLSFSASWARMNNAQPQNWSEAISVEYGELSGGKYDKVTIKGNLGDVRYILFDGNGSSSACAEIELFYEGAPVPKSIEIEGKDSIQLTNNQSAEEIYTAAIKDIYDEPIDAQPVWSIESETLKGEKVEGGYRVYATDAAKDGDTATIKASFGSAEQSKTVTLTRLKAKSVKVEGESTVKAYTSLLPEAVAVYKASVTDALGNEIQADVSFKTDDTDHFAISKDGELTVLDTTEVGVYALNITAVVAAQDSESGKELRSAAFEVNVEVSDEAAIKEYKPYELLWFRANGKNSDGIYDGGCGSNWYYLNDDALKLSNEIESGTGFGAVLGFDINGLDKSYEPFEFKLNVSSDSATEELAIWTYTGARYYGDTVIKSEVTGSIKTMLPSWNPLWVLDGIAAENSEPIAKASLENGAYSFNLNKSYEELKAMADENGILSFFISSSKLSSTNSKTKIYLKGEKAPELSVQYRKRAVAQGIAISGSDSLIFSGDGQHSTTADAYKSVFTTQYEDKTLEITDGTLEWSISGSEYAICDSKTGIITVLEAMPYGKTELVLSARYNNGEVSYSADKTITLEKRAIPVPAQIKLLGNKRIDALTSALPLEYAYTAQVLNQFGEPMSDVELEWRVDGMDKVSINENGVLSIGTDAKSGFARIKVQVKGNAAIYAEQTVEISLAKYASVLYPSADVLFRKSNSDEKNVNGAEIEITNSADDDRGLSGGLKFDISSIRQAVESNQPIISVKLRLTASLSKDGKLVIKPLSNDWDESDSQANSYSEKEAIIANALASDSYIIENTLNKSFKLNRTAKDKYIYADAPGENETIASWQTELDISDYLLGTGEDGANKNGYLKDNPDESYVSFLIAANYNGTNANKIFTKDVSETTYSEHWDELTAKFPELSEDVSALKPAILVDYARETVEISANTAMLPIPKGDINNSTALSAVYKNPFTGAENSEIVWSISGYRDSSGSDYSGAPEGVSINENGVLTVTKTAPSAVIKVRASSKTNNVVYSEYEIELIQAAQRLINGSFETVTAAMMPYAWTSNDPDSDSAHNGVQHYTMSQSSEGCLSNITRTNDDESYLSGQYTTDPDSNRALMFKGAKGISADYEGYAYAHNAANSTADKGPDIRVSSGISYWVSQDYRMDNLYQLNPSRVVGPYLSYEGFQGTTSKKTQFNGSWYFKDGSGTSAYSTKGYNTITNIITIPDNVNRLRFNWGFKAAEGTIYYRNLNVAPQGIDKSKTAADGENSLRVTGKMTWTSAAVTVSAGEEYAYRISALTDTAAAAKAKLVFKSAEGMSVKETDIEIGRANAWKEVSGVEKAPENAAYAQIVLTNSTQNANVWYDNIVLTPNSASAVTELKITAADKCFVIPTSGENRYILSAAVTDQYNAKLDAPVKWACDYAGVRIEDGGALIIGAQAQEGKFSVTASSGTVSDSLEIELIKQAVSAEQVLLKNGSFSEKDGNMPLYWTNGNKDLSIANGSFDTSITGWKLNYTTYTNADTEAMIDWDSSVDHSANSGGAARIYNADRAQGSMQISENILIAPSSSYDVSVWVKTENVSSDSNVYASLIIYDKDGKTLEENKQLLVFYPKDNDGSGNNTSDWTKLSGSFYVNDKAYKLRIDLRYRGGGNNSNGTVWFDDLVIAKQTGLDAGGGLKINGYGAAEQWDSDPITGITPGQSYRFAADVKTENADKGAYIKISYYDADGRLVGEENSAKYSSEKNEWLSINAAATAPKGSAYAVMSLCVDGSGSAVFNNAVFENKADIVVKGIEIAGNEVVMIPSENYYYAQVIDQYGIKSSLKNIEIKADKLPSGVSFDSASGKLSVSEAAKGMESFTLSASADGISAAKNLTTAVKATSIRLNGQSKLSIPTSGNRNYIYTVVNQENQVIDSTKVKWTVLGQGISMENGVLTVNAATAPTKIKLTAEFDGLFTGMDIELALNTVNNNGGGGGGGGGASGGGTSMSGTASTPIPKPMGNFGAANGAVSDDKTQKLPTDSSIIPQPDPDYFVQGLDSVAGFKDIADVAWAHEAIAALSNVKLINGKEEGVFAPHDSVTRAEFVKMLIGTLRYGRLIGESAAELSFTDVAKDSWAYEYIQAAYEYGIVTGRSADEFAPNERISRQDICVMIKRACEVTGIELKSGARLLFNDSSDISGYAADAVDALSRSGIIAGFDDGSFKPKADATRAQAALIIYRMSGGAR